MTHKHIVQMWREIYLSTDYYGRYEQCLQCGYSMDLDAHDDSKKQSPQTKKQSATA